MRRIREVLRLKHECGLSHRGISASTGMSKGSVSDYLRRAEEAGLTWEQARELDDGALEARLFINVGQNLPPARAPIDHRWVHTELQKRGVTLQAVEILHRRQRVASHARSYGPKGTMVTDPSHRPKSHRDYNEWPPSRVLGWAESLGPNVGALVRRLLEDKPHPEQGYRSCLALFRDIKRFDRARVDTACARALEIGAPRRKTVVALLQRGLERRSISPPPPRPPVPHEHIRGGGYYDRKEMQPDDLEPT